MSNNIMPTMPTALDYAPPIPWHRRRKLRRAAIVGAILITLTTLGYIYGPAASRRATMLYWQHRCMTHLDPPSTLKAEISTTLPYSHPLSSDYRSFFDTVDPMCLGNVDDTGGLFLHARNSLAGQRLVCFTFFEIGSHVVLIGGVFQPGTLWRDPHYNSPSIPPNYCNILVLPGDTLRFYAGQPDPADESAFDIPLEYNGKPHTMHFRLNARGDATELVSITPPLSVFSSVP
jgi:hypothetical protein